MGTRFEILLYGAREGALRAAGEEALDEVERQERLLSAFRADSAISRLNARAASGPVAVEPDVFRLLERCRQLWQETGGFFDVTVGPLMECWGFRYRRAAAPSEEEVRDARRRVGMQHLALSDGQRTVQFLQEGLSLDVGGIGKGWAIDAAADILREAGVTSALLHGGTSTACAIGSPPGSDAWKIGIRPPPAELLQGGQPWEQPFVREVILRDSCLSVSAIAGRMVDGGAEWEGHVMDPLTGIPVRQALLAAVVGGSATAADAYSTALLAGGEEFARDLHGRHPDLSLLILRQHAGEADELPVVREYGW
jgi:FAD:protein FMN transferase